MADLSEVNGVDLGETYRTDVYADKFCFFIAEAERNRLREEVKVGYP